MRVLQVGLPMPPPHPRDPAFRPLLAAAASSHRHLASANPVPSSFLFSGAAAGVPGERRRDSWLLSRRRLRPPSACRRCWVAPSTSPAPRARPPPLPAAAPPRSSPSSPRRRPPRRRPSPRRPPPPTTSSPSGTAPTGGSSCRKACWTGRRCPPTSTERSPESKFLISSSGFLVPGGQPIVWSCRCCCCSSPSSPPCSYGYDPFGLSKKPEDFAK